MLKKFLIILGILGIFSVAHATTVFNSNQVGTSPVNGYYLETNGTTSTWNSVSAGSGVATTTINGAQCPTFTFTPVTTSSASSITTSTCTIFFNLLTYSSGTNINVAANGTISFLDSPAYIAASTTATSSWVLMSNGSAWVASSSASGGGTPAGSSYQLQYNNGGAFGATNGLTVASSVPEILIGSSTDAYQASFSTSSVSTSTTQTFSYTGSVATYTAISVPALAYNISHTFVITAKGAVGGTPSASFPGGNGGTATGTYTNNSTGQLTFYYLIGQSGAIGSATTTGGGGAGGTHNNTGEGGGMTWISTSTTFATSTVMLVAAGGAGGSNVSGANGGYGGGTTGGAGGNGGGTGGGGGTQVGGGAAGSSAGGSGTAGTAGQGGNGETGSFTSEDGSGGGGGYYGGGGGGAGYSSNGSGGGGGSSYLSSVLTSTSTATSTNNATGTLTIAETLSYSLQSPITSTSTPTGAYGLSVQGNSFYAATSSPILSSCGTVTGSSTPLISGNNERSVVTPASGSPMSCTLTFTIPFDHASCVAEVMNDSSPVYTSVTNALVTSTVTYNFSATPPEFTSACDGY